MVFESKKKKKKTDDKVNDKLIEEKAQKDIEKFANIKDEDLIAHIKNESDKTNKKNNLSKLFPYWVYIFKNDKKVNDFGVKVIEYRGINLLVRIENVNGTNKVVFKELYPESKLDLEDVYVNRLQIKQELNRLKQIENTLQKETFNSKKEKKSYNYSLKDVRLAILEKEIQLHSIQYGRSFRYTQPIRNDNIDSFFYSMENSGLRLIKYVKEKNLFVEASEVKRLDNIGQKKEIDETLPNQNSRDWLKTISMALLILFTIGNMWCFFKWATYNDERAFENAQEKLDEMFITMSEGLADVSKNIGESSDNEQLISTIQKQNELLINEIRNLKTLEKKEVG